MVGKHLSSIIKTMNRHFIFSKKDFESRQKKHDVSRIHTIYPQDTEMGGSLKQNISDILSNNKPIQAKTFFSFMKNLNTDIKNECHEEKEQIQQSIKQFLQHINQEKKYTEKDRADFQSFTSGLLSFDDTTHTWNFFDIPAQKHLQFEMETVNFQVDYNHEQKSFVLILNDKSSSKDKYYCLLNEKYIHTLKQGNWKDILEKSQISLKRMELLEEKKKDCIQSIKDMLRAAPSQNSQISFERMNDQDWQNIPSQNLSILITNHQDHIEHVFSFNPKTFPTHDSWIQSFNSFLTKDGIGTLKGLNAIQEENVQNQEDIISLGNLNGLNAIQEEKEENFQNQKDIISFSSEDQVLIKQTTSNHSAESKYLPSQSNFPIKTLNKQTTSNHSAESEYPQSQSSFPIQHLKKQKISGHSEQSDFPQSYLSALNPIQNQSLPNELQYTIHLNHPFKMIFPCNENNDAFMQQGMKWNEAHLTHYLSEDLFSNSSVPLKIKNEFKFDILKDQEKNLMYVTQPCDSVLLNPLLEHLSIFEKQKKTWKEEKNQEDLKIKEKDLEFSFENKYKEYDSYRDISMHYQKLANFKIEMTTVEGLLNLLRS
jgi:hypothetical protein